VIAAYAAAAVIKPEPRAARMLVTNGGAVDAITPDAKPKLLIPNAQDAAYSPDGTLVAFARGGDIWVANADGSGQRRLAATPAVEEWAPSWLPGGTSIVYTANVAGRRQIRIVQLPTGPSTRIAASNAEEYGATVSPGGKLAFVSTRSGTPAIYVADASGLGATAFDTTPRATPFADIHDLAWSPDGTKLAYDAVLADGTTGIVIDDGATQTQLPPGAQPVWSPGGTRIAFASNGDLMSVALDGTDVRTLGFGTPLDWRVVPIGTPKFPNLVQRPPSELVIEHRADGHWLLGFTSMVDNRGPGILWIRAARAPGQHVMVVHQLIQLAGGGRRVDAPSGELKYVNAPPHHHWHFLGFDHYELRSVADFKLIVRDYKSGFCIADHWGHAIGVPHGPPRFLGDCAQFHPGARAVEEGSSVGYTDRYPAFFHGQQLDVTKVPAGRYWLVHRANEDFHLRESSYADDAASILIRLTWRAGAPTVTRLRTCLRERC
jgi:DNA-binding beta-propeller fold protein YncE